MIKRVLIILFWFGLASLVFNDAGRYATAYVDLRSSTGQVLDNAAMGASKLSSAQLSKQLATYANVQGIRVTQFATTANTVTVWTEEDVSDTWVLGPYLAVNRGVPIQQALATPFTIKYTATATLR